MVVISYQCLHLLQAILHRKYSSASDMWSFGVVLYEIWSMGQKPFDGKLNEEVGSRISIYVCAGIYTITHTHTYIHTYNNTCTHIHTCMWSTVCTKWYLHHLHTVYQQCIHIRIHLCSETCIKGHHYIHIRAVLHSTLMWVCYITLTYQ